MDLTCYNYLKLLRLSPNLINLDYQVLGICCTAHWAKLKRGAVGPVKEFALIASNAKIAWDLIAVVGCDRKSVY